jgi:hypothetical protein
MMNRNVYLVLVLYRAAALYNMCVLNNFEGSSKLLGSSVMRFIHQTKRRKNQTTFKSGLKLIVRYPLKFTTAHATPSPLDFPCRRVGFVGDRGGRDEGGGSSGRAWGEEWAVARDIGR